MDGLMTRRSNDDDAGARELRQCQIRQCSRHVHIEYNACALILSLCPSRNYGIHSFCTPLTIDIGHDVPTPWTVQGLRSWSCAIIHD